MSKELIEAIHDFNQMSGFVIADPSSVSEKARLDGLAPKVRAHIPALARYQAIRERGYSDDHLATEIGLFVIHINRVIVGEADASLMEHY